MGNFTGNVGHIITLVVITVAVSFLAATNKITGAEALLVITAAGGVSLGGSVASVSAGGPTPNLVVTSSSPGTSTSTSASVTTTPPSTSTSSPADTVTAALP